ncbi:MAG: glutamyl-tRNA reductase [Actinomycetota bacterium]|nr:glutamyl-tRNA reductase [Actinomycetota bacterium]
MSIVVIGINHRTSPVNLLEKMTIADSAMPKALHSLSVRDDIREVVVLSTCNRTEVYAVAERFHGAYDDIRDFFCETSGLTSDEVTPHLFSQHDEAAISHLFEVAAGLDSAVLGEVEVIGQVRDAWERAMSEGVSRSSLNLLFRYALEVGKRARTETGISRSTASVSHAAVEMAHDILGTLEGKHVLVVGAGEMGEGVATALSREGAGSVAVINRTASRGEALADKVGARLSQFDNLETEVSAADVIVSCTGSGSAVLTASMVRTARKGIDSPLLIVDIALPRDVDPAVGNIDGVTLRDLDHLKEWANRGLEKRAAEVDQVRSIVGEETERFVLEQAQRQAAPLISQLREAVDAIRTAEIERLAGRMADFTEEQRETVETITRGIVAKLLHNPSVSLREAAGSAQGERLSAAVRDLFNLH